MFGVVVFGLEPILGHRVIATRPLAFVDLLIHFLVCSIDG